jgi:outer membrane protein OmpA-like peptidoglycan-associated protein/tetratricopeptide (TPR) repeat protein
MKKLLILAALFTAVTATAQFTYDYLKAADDYYKKGDYYSAAQYYEKYLAGGKGKGNKDTYNPYVVQTSSKKSTAGLSSKEQAIYHLAESYRQLNYPAKAEPAYREVLNSTEFPLARFHHATMLRALEKFEEAEKAFNSFLDGYKTADQYSEKAKREILNLRFIQQQLKRTDLNYFNLAKAPQGMNSEGANYAPVWLNTTTLLFTSTRPDSSASKKQVHNNRIYQAEYAGGAIGAASKIQLPEAKDVHQGVVSMTADGNTLFLTRWTFGEGPKAAAIYWSRKSGSGWSEPVQLDASINVAGSNTQQPFVMPGGKHLLFSSDRPGGMGGFDLYLATIDGSGNVSNPVNLGPTINTSFDEQAPFYHGPTESLVFATNGRVGMGGYDLFQSKGRPGSWAEPMNLGYPVNYVKDDIYFTSRGSAKNILEDVLFSSDRNAACCLELYSLKRTMPSKQINGLVVACESGTPLAGATIRIMDTVNNRTVFTKTTGSDGSYSFSAEEFAPLKAVATAEGYVSGTLSFNAPADQSSLSLSNPAICLAKVPEVGETVVLQNIYYAFNKAQLLEESNAALDMLVELLVQNPRMTMEISGHTDNLGNDAYNQKLSEARAQSVVTYLLSKGIDPSRVVAKGYGESRPVAPNRTPAGKDNPEGRKQNRRTEFKVLSN